MLFLSALSFSTALRRALLAALALGLPAAAVAQVCNQTITNDANTTYNITTANQVVCVTATTLSRNIIIDAPNCTVNFSGSSYTGSLTVTIKGTNCVINNNSGSNVSGSSNAINATTTINNNSGAAWSGNFYNGGNRITAPLTVVNAGTWGGGNQLEAKDNLTFTNTGTVNGVTFYGGSTMGQVFVLSNSGIWSGQVGANFTGSLSISNSSSKTWSASLAMNSLTAFAINNQGTWDAALNTFTVGSPGNANITNSGTWNNQGFGQLTGTTTITNSGVWNNTQVSVSGSLTINHSNTTANTWQGVPVNESALTVNNSGNWGLDINFSSTGPNTFTTLAGGTTTQGNGLIINRPTTFQNNGTFTISKPGFVLPAGSSISNLAGTFNLSGGVDNQGSISNQATLNVTAYRTSTNTGTLVNSRSSQINVSSSFTNSGTVTNNGTVATIGSFNNSGTIIGPASPLRGNFTVTGTSANSGFFGGKTSANQLNFCESNPTQTIHSGFDIQSGTIGSTTTICSATPLPVELVRFDAAVANGRVVLSWATASEKNTAYFAVERSADGHRFESLSTTKGQGTSTTLTEYQATDGQPLAGQSYYRLRQVDADGTTSYSPVSAVNLETRLISFTLTPNPTSDEVLITLAAGPAQPGTGDVFSLNGQLMLSQSWEGGGAVPLDVRTLPAGVYLLRIRTAGQQTMHRLLKL